jgi:hypothetical protein
MDHLGSPSGVEFGRYKKIAPHTACGATRDQDLLVVSLTLLICNGAGSLARRLAGSLAVAAAALLSALLQVSLVDGHDVLHVYLPPFM